MEDVLHKLVHPFEISSPSRFDARSEISITNWTDILTERSITTDKVDLEFVSCPIICTNKKLVFYTYVQYMCIYSISMYTRNKS